MHNIASAELKNHTSSQQLNIDASLIKTLYQQANTALIGVVATATGITAIFYNEVSNQTVFAWLVTIYFLSAIRYYFIVKFKASDLSMADTIRWGSFFSFFAFLSGLTWGGASVIFYTPDNLELFNILTLIIIAMSVGSLAALSANPRSYYFFIIPAMLPMIWRYLSIDDQNYVVFGLLLFVLNFALFKIVRVNHKILRDSVILQFKNIDLIDQLTVEKEKAEKANVSKTKFLAAASHDLRQPLHAISLFLGALEERVEKDDQKKIVQKIQTSSNSLNDLLDSLLDISKLDAGVIQVHLDDFPINNLFNTLENEFAVSANERNLSIKFVKTTLWVNTDYQVLERIIRNLVSNAIRYTNKGGIVVGCRRQQEKIILAVYDTGIGITDDSLQDIFQEFTQLHNPERDRSKGLGLGLAIVQRMTKMLGLNILVKSIPGKGSMFGVAIPVSLENEPGSVVTSSSTNIQSFEEKTILIIDDEEDIRESMSELLHNWHFNVISTSSGNEAVYSLQQSGERPDIILSDYRLRENETGNQAIEKVHSYFNGEKIPSIIITGDTAPDRIKEAKNSGYKLLHKPISPKELKSTLAELISGKN